MKEYHFGASSFRNELWIRQKAVFDKPDGVDVEFLSAGAFDWIVADPDGKPIKTVRNHNEHGGWASIHLPSLGLYNDYSIGFRKANDTPLMKIKQGVVSYA
jgi:hypothetical protein